MSRILTVVRIQLVGWQSTVGWTWGLLALIFAVNYVIFRSIAGVEDDPKTGALVSIYIVMFVTSINWITQLFPFTMALSVIRRTFFLASSLLLVVQSVVFGVLLFLCRLVEEATDGWGLGLQFFGLGFMDQHNPVMQILVYAVPFITLGYLGIFLALFYKRFGVFGMYALTAGTVLALAALALAATWLELWADLGRWLGDQPTAALLVGWPAVFAALLAGASFLAIRRATP